MDAAYPPLKDEIDEQFIPHDKPIHPVKLRKLSSSENDDFEEGLRKIEGADYEGEDW